MNAKITVPKEVAAAIRFFTDLADSKSEAFTDILSMGFEGTNSEIILRHFDGNHDELMEALICGYDVEQTPEEKIRDYYDLNKRHYDDLGEYENEYYGGVLDGVESVLDYLGIKIEGVNA
jgi:hypothetical protein